MVKIGVFGFGYWGPNLVRNFSATNGCVVKKVVDTREERLKKVNELYPSIEVSTDADSIFEDETIDGVVITLPVSLHHEFSRKALFKGKHVLVEKPFTRTKKEALELIDIATEKNKVLMVDHTYLYTGAVQKIKKLVSAGELGEIQYFDSVRINLGLFQHDVNVIWDLAPHDISILMYLAEEQPKSVIATGISHTDNKIENIAYLIVNFNSNKIAHFTSSWTSPVKIRQILIGGTKKMVLFDDLEPTEKVKVYDSGYKVKGTEDKNRLLVDYRTGDIYIPKIDQKEALRGVTEDFVDCVTNGKKPLSTCESGLAVVSILEAAQMSIENRGKEILL